MTEKIVQFLEGYTSRSAPALEHLDVETAHQLANVFITFKHGLYNDTVQRCERALELVAQNNGGKDLEKALSIILTRAQDLSERGTITSPLPLFAPDERARLALVFPVEETDDTSHLQLTNALLLVYAAGIAASPIDVQALEEQQNYLVQMLSTYKEKIRL